MTRDQFIHEYVLRRCAGLGRPTMAQTFKPASEDEMRALAAQAFDDARLWADALPAEFFTDPDR